MSVTVAAHCLSSEGGEDCCSRFRPRLQAPEQDTEVSCWIGCSEVGNWTQEEKQRAGIGRRSQGAVSYLGASRGQISPGARQGGVVK